MQSSLHHASLGPSLSRRRPQTASALSPILTVTYSDRCIGYNVAALQSRPSPADMKRLLLPAVLATILAAGCAQNSTPAPYGSCATQPSKPQAVRTSAAPELKAKAQAAADDAGKPASCIVAAPLFRPDFRAGVRFDETQRMRFSFSKEAVSEGAPEQIPDFSASIIVKGDSISASIAAASILAKTARDRLMVEMDGLYPGYGFAGHKGYHAQVHVEALRTLGPCPIHRRGWEPIRAALGRTRHLAEQMNLASLTPRNELASTGYCLACPGEEYLVYQPVGAQPFSLELKAGTYQIEWIHPTQSERALPERLQTGDGAHEFKAPFPSAAALHIKSSRL